MIIVRPGDERGHADHGWLDSRHSFSFADYHDPRYMGVSVLRVINEDRVEPGQGFATHPHRDMEIISYVLEGCIEHRDSMGMHSRLEAGEVQVMSAGSGIYHSEFNPSPSERLHFLQIWIRPSRPGVTPRYQQQDFSAVQGIRLIVSPDGEDGSLTLHQQARLFKVSPGTGAQTFPCREGHTYYLQVARGALSVNGTRLAQGDGATLIGEPYLDIQTGDKAEALLFELP